MTDQETIIFNRLTGYAVHSVEAERVQQNDLMGTRVHVKRASEEVVTEFFFPDYAGMSDVEMAEVIANNFKRDLWNSVRP